MDSILTTVKKLLGIEEEYEIFDMDIIIHINSVFNILHQLGIGPEEGFAITDKTTYWSDYIPNNAILLNMVKSYVGLKVRKLFDPPTGAAAEASNELINELEWRINLVAEQTGFVNKTEGGEEDGP